MKSICLTICLLIIYNVALSQDNPNFYLAEDGMTCMCPDAAFGETGTLTINGEDKTFTKRTLSDLQTIIITNYNNPEISLTCTSGITDMSFLFPNYPSFNQPLQHWDVSNVTDMSQMFLATNFNQDISNWDVSNVTDMSQMFMNTPYFNQPLNNWNVSSVTNMNFMFSGAYVFNQDIGSWDVSNVNNMAYMFSSSSAFNQNLNNWDVSSVVTMQSMFRNSPFNQPLSNWDVSNVVVMSSMFQDATSFNQDLSMWCVGHISSLPNNFYENAAYNFTSNSSYHPKWGIAFELTYPYTYLETIHSQCAVTSIDAPTAYSICDDTIISGTTETVFPITEYTLVTWTYTDSNGNTRNQQQFVNVDDTENPVPDTAVLNTIEEPCEVTNIVPPTATDNCDGTLVATTFTSFPITESKTIYWSFTDSSGNNTLQSQEVTILDQENPSVTSQDISRTLDANGTATVALSDVITDITDNCAVVTSFFSVPEEITTDLSTVYAIGIEDWYYNGGGLDYPSFQSYDYNEGTATLSNPNLLFSIDEFDDNLEDPYWPIAFDRDPSTGINYFIIGDGPRSLLTYDFDTDQVTDTNVNIDGNASDMTFDKFGTAYVWIGNNIKTLNIESGLTTSLVNVSNQTGGGKGLTYDYDNHRLILASGGNYNSNEIIIGAVDLASNAYTELTRVTAPLSPTEQGDYATFQGIEYIGDDTFLVSGGWYGYMFGTLTLVNQEDGSVQALLDITIPNTYALNPSQPAIKDLFVPFTFVNTADTLAFDCSQVGDNTVTVVARDQAGNTTTSQVVITIEDSSLPVVQTQNTTVQIDENGIATITAGELDNGSFDDCGDLQLTLDIDSFDCTNLGENNVTLTATDSFGNESNGMATVLVEDLIAPTLVTQNISVTLDNTGSVSLNANDIAGDSFDNCGIETLTVVPSTLTCVNLGINDIIVFATDSSGNQSFSFATVTVLDDEVPTVSLQDITVQLDENGEANITLESIDNGIGDNCTIDSSSLDITDFDCSNLGDNTVTVTVIDASGNQTTETAIVTVVDTQAPTANLASLQDVEAQCEVQSITAPTATDNCDASVITGINDTVFPITESTTVTWTYTDSSGNSTTQTQEIVIADTQAPTANLSSLQNVEAQCEVQSITAPTATDNCDASVITGVTNVVFPITESTTVTWTYTDSSGNSATQTQEVVIADTQMPTISALTTFNLELVEGQATLSVSQIDTGTTDNCGIAQQELSQTTFTCDDLVLNAPITVVYTVVDESGNESSQNIAITLSVTDGYCESLNLENFNYSQLRVFPNPSQSMVYVANYNQAALQQVQLVNMLGQIVQNLSPSSLSQGIDVSNLKSGSYLIRFTFDSNKIVTKRLIIQ